MKRFLWGTAVLLIAVALLVSITVPPRQLKLPNPSPDTSIPGILHVHTNRSDGQSGIDEIAAAAARAGLTFVVFTDHGDATATPEPPAYKSGVLCIDAVEISTTGGHYIALDMPAAPYPLGGEARDVVEDVHRLGGFGIVAHPDSPKPELRWRDWALPFDGIETLNLDSGWRAWVQRAGASPGPGSAPLPLGGPSAWHARGRLAAALLDYPFRPVETIATLMPSDALLETYHELTRARRVVATAGADAHAKLQFNGDPTGSGYSLPIPGYESTFRALSVHITPDRPLTGDAAADGRLLMHAIRAGHLYTTVDAIATPPAIDFAATNMAGSAGEGDELGAGGPVTLRVRSNAPPEFTTTVWNGAAVVSGTHHEQEFSVQAPTEQGTFWVSIGSNQRGREGSMWVLTNPIYVGEPTRASETMPPDVVVPGSAGEPLFDGKSTAGWQVEHDPDSQAAAEVAPAINGTELRLRYALAGGGVAGQFLALAHDTPNNVTAGGRLGFAIRAEQPMRVSVQMRVPGAGRDPGERWQRSVYADATLRTYAVAFRDLTPVGTTRTPLPPFGDVRSVLFVIDTVNTKPGTSGRLWLSNVTLSR